jgi:YidC/Oxa1 family membrane protein insertase
VQDQQPPPIDIKRLIIGMVLTMTVVFGWTFGVRWLYKTQGWMTPEERQRQEQLAAATKPVAGPTTQTATTVPTTGPGGAPATGPAGTGTSGLRIAAATTAPSQPVALGSDAFKDKTYALRLALDPVGAGVQSVTLNDYKRSVEDPRPYVFQQPYAGHEAQSRPLATRWVNLNGQTFDLGNIPWQLAEGSTAQAATYTLDVAADSGPVARLRKTYRVFPRDTKERAGSAGFEVAVDYTVENLTTAELTIKSAFNGPTLPPSEISRGPDRQVLSGHKDGTRVHVVGHMVEAFKPEDPTIDLTQDKDKRPAIWAGAASVYFDAIVLPTEAQTGGAPAGYVRSIKAEGINVGKDTEGADRTVATVFETGELKVPPGGRVTMPLNAYFGPRWRSILNNAYYASLPRGYNSTLVIASGYCAICTFQWLIDALVWMLNGFHLITRDWGLAIICLVVLVRALLHPVTKRSQISMMKMGKMGPEMQRLKEKYGDNKEELSKAMWEFQKTQGVTPILGCLPMFLQMPIWIALWSSLQGTFELRQAPFLWGYTWIHDLAKPDALIRWQTIHLPFGIHLDSLNLLPVLLGVVFFIQQKMQPKPVAATPEQAQQQKMMQWMSLLFPLFLYNGPSGLNLYIMTSTTIGIIESKRIRDHIKQREEAEKAGKVFVEAKPTRASKRNRGDDAIGGPRGGAQPPKKPSPGGWLARKLAELQEKADQVKRDTDRKTR